MTLVKTDRPRRIDQVIDYFGISRPDAASAPGYERAHEAVVDHSRDVCDAWIEA
jgi:hypothetical protein